MGLKLDIRIRAGHGELEVNLSLCCPSGRILALVGPSGAGKTTVIRSVAGLLKPRSGFVGLDREVWVDTARGIFVPPQRRAVGYVFQDYALFPHLSLERNVAFAAADRSLARDLMQRFGIWARRSSLPAQVSGGERQRAALAQALARQPGVLLLDEPFSALDVATRRALRQELVRVKDEFRLPVLLVTHDLSEALELADMRLAMRDGAVDHTWWDTVASWAVRSRPAPAGQDAAARPFAA